MVGYEQDVQVAKDGAGDGLESCGCGSSEIWPSVRSTNCLPRAQGVSQHRLSRLDALSGRFAQSVLGYLTDQGPKTDIRDLAPTLSHTSRRVRIEWLTADAGYDRESNHRLCRDEHGIRTLIPPTHGRPTPKSASGRYRRLIRTRFNKTYYGQRWQVETVVSMIKRRLGSAVSGHTYWSRRRDLMLLVLTHNIMILLPFKLLQQIEVFYRPPPTHLHFPTTINLAGRWSPLSKKS